MKNNIEKRAFTCELRESPDKPTTIVGYAAVFNQLSVDLGGYKERIKPGAFTDVLNAPDIDVTCNVDHNDARIVGRFRRVAGVVEVETLKLVEDDYGLSMSLDVPDTTEGRDIAVLMKNKIVNKMSFAFTSDPNTEIWTNEDGLKIREVTKMTGLFDTAIVVHPAYEQTEATLRSLQGLLNVKEPVDKIKTKPILERAKMLLRLLDR